MSALHVFRRPQVHASHYSPDIADDDVIKKLIIIRTIVVLDIGAMKYVDRVLDIGQSSSILLFVGASLIYLYEVMQVSSDLLYIYHTVQLPIHDTQV